jgi:hypothetical protein
MPRNTAPRAGRNLVFANRYPTMASRADLVPSFLDTAEMAKDRKLVADLAFYQNVRQAAKRGVSGADTIYNDLKERFPGRPKKEPEPPANP